MNHKKYFQNNEVPDSNLSENSDKENMAFMNLGAQDNLYYKHCMSVLSESDEEFQGRVRTYSFDPEKYDLSCSDIGEDWKNQSVTEHCIPRKKEHPKHISDVII